MQYDVIIAPVDEEHPLVDEDQQIAEVVITEGSRLAGRTLSGLRFADRYGMIMLAIHRAGRHPEKIYDGIGDIRLKSGDILLVQGPREQMAGLKKEKDFLVLDATADLPFASKAPVALLIMLGKYYCFGRRGISAHRDQRVAGGAVDDFLWVPGMA